MKINQKEVCLPFSFAFIGLAFTLLFSYFNLNQAQASGEENFVQIEQLADIEKAMTETSSLGRMQLALMNGFGPQACAYIQDDYKHGYTYFREICIGIKLAFYDRCHLLKNRESISKYKINILDVAYNVCKGATKAFYKVSCEEERNPYEKAFNFLRKVSYFDNGFGPVKICEGIKTALLHQSCDELPLQKKAICLAAMESKKNSSFLKSIAGEPFEKQEMKNFEQKICTICLEEYNATKVTEIVYPCGHKFCTGCLKNWQAQKIRNKEAFDCPNCRAIIVPEEERVPDFFEDKSKLIRVGNGKCIRETSEGIFLESLPVHRCGQ